MQVLEDAGGRVAEVFLVGNAGGHVERLLHGGIRPGAVFQLRQVLRDQGVRVDDPFLDQHRREQAGERLAHGPQRVRLVRRHAGVVLLVDDRALVQHEQAVGVRRALPVGQADACRPCRPRT